MELKRKNLDKYEQAIELIDEVSTMIEQAEYLITEAGDILEELKLIEYKDELETSRDSDDYVNLALKMNNNHSELECVLSILEADESYKCECCELDECNGGCDR